MTGHYYDMIDADDPLGEKFTATDLVRGTWSAAIQHGGPVSALLVRALERCGRRDDTRLSRVVVDLLGPVPAEGDLWVRPQLLRAGRQIELLSADMLALGPDGRPRPVARASGWRMQKIDTASITTSIGAAAGAPPAFPPLAPVSEARSRNLEQDWDRNYLHSLEWRWLTEPFTTGPGDSWNAPRVDLVRGEAMTQLERLFAVADCANGIGSKLDIAAWTFLNTDLAVHVFRVPDGEWIGIRAETSYGPDGIGTTVGTLFDQQGPVGAIQQSVLVRRRPAESRA